MDDHSAAIAAVTAASLVIVTVTRSASRRCDNTARPSRPERRRERWRSRNLPLARPSPREGAALKARQFRLRSRFSWPVSFLKTALWQLRAISEGSRTPTTFPATKLCAYSPAKPPKSGPGGRMEEFDYLVLGGGSGGCVVASRLSEDPNVSVALVEAGNDGRGWVVRTPVAVVAMLPTKLNNWAYATVPQPGLADRFGYQPRGKALGGSSAINAMVYIRGHRDRLRSLGGARQSGWSYDDVLPYFRKVRKQRNHHGRLPRQGRSAERRGLARQQSVPAIFPRCGARNATAFHRRFQRRGTGRLRRLSGDADQRRAMQRGARLYPSAFGPPQSHGDDRRHDRPPAHPREAALPARSSASAGRRKPCARGARSSCPPARSERPRS